MPTIKISKELVLPTLNSIPNGQFFHLHFKRKAPKCLACGKSSPKWQGLTECPHCGQPLSFERESLAQQGVVNPSHVNAPNGTGESNAEAKAAGRFKYYDPQAPNADGTKGDYRQCYIDAVTRIAYGGVEFIVK